VDSDESLKKYYCRYLNLTNKIVKYLNRDSLKKVEELINDREELKNIIEQADNNPGRNNQNHEELINLLMKISENDERVEELLKEKMTEIDKMLGEFKKNQKISKEYSIKAVSAEPKILDWRS